MTPERLERARARLQGLEFRDNPLANAVVDEARELLAEVDKLRGDIAEIRAIGLGHQDNARALASLVYDRDELIAGLRRTIDEQARALTRLVLP